MLGLLVKKQLTEVFRGFFFDSKKNTAKQKSTVIWLFILYGLLIVGVIGGMFTVLAFTLCGALSLLGYGWLYYVIFGGTSVILGVFGSVFSTYASLYLAKDNDLLLSLPIPVKYIIASRLIDVFLMGAMFTLPALLPGYIVYLCIVEASFATIVCGFLYIVMILLIVMILSCLLGWVVAKISVKIKNKSIVTVLISLLILGLYYFVYFKAQSWIQELIANAEIYGDRVKDKAYVLYLLGRAPEGDWLSTAIFFGGTLLILLLVWLLLKKTFLSIAISTGVQKKKVYRSATVKEKSGFGALLSKEFRRFISNPTYMLNCGLGIIMAVLLGIALLIKGGDIFTVFEVLTEAGVRDMSAVILCIVLGMVISMIEPAAPAVSLEGKSFWIVKSLPVEPKTALHAKAMMQFLLSAVPVMFAAICGCIAMKAGALTWVAVLMFTLAISVFFTLFDTFLGIRFANLSWSNEAIPIKQSAAVMIAIFGAWGIMLAFAVPFFFIPKVEPWLYLCIWTVIFFGLSLLLLRLVDTKGVEKFENL